MPLRITALKFLPPIPQGYRRTFKQCSVCKRIAYVDYVPYSLSVAIEVPPCKHRSTNLQPIDQQVAMRMLLEQRIAQVAA